MNINGYTIKPKADLRGANLRHADLRGANLRHACLNGADMYNSYLGGADLSKADLRGVNLEAAYLDDTNLKGAYLEGANLHNVFEKLIFTFKANRHFGYYCDGYLSIGCRCYSIRHWLRNSEKVGKEHDYTKEDISMYTKIIQFIYKEIHHGY